MVALVPVKGELASVQREPRVGDPVGVAPAGGTDIAADGQIIFGPVMAKDHIRHLANAVRGQQPGDPRAKSEKVKFDPALAGKGDGWRYANMPSDRKAYPLALDALAGFGALAEHEQEAKLTLMALGQFVATRAPNDKHKNSEVLCSKQTKYWFEDLRADLVRIWLSHPATMARIGFDGFANGGDGIRKQGFERLAADERESWEPLVEMSR